MAVTDFNTTEWHNADGLLVRFGTGEARVERVGAYANVDGDRHCVQAIVDLVALSALSTFGSDIDVILSDTVTIPDNSLIEEVRLTVMEVTAGSSATLDFGLIKLDRATAIDADGLLVAATTGWHTEAIGTTVVYRQGSTEHGALLGTQITDPGLLTCQVDGAAYTAGVLKLQVLYSHPLAADLVSP